MNLNPTGPVVVGHSWVSRLRADDVLPPNFSFIDVPGGNVNSLANVLSTIPTHQNNDYVFLILGGNDIADCWDLLEVKNFQARYEEFIVLLRAVFPYARLVTAQIEVRFLKRRGTLVEDIDFRRRGAKFNKWLNTFQNKEGLLPIRGANFFSLPFWYAPDGVHLNHAGNIRLGTIIENNNNNNRLINSQVNH